MGSLIWIDQCSHRFRHKKHYCPTCNALLTRYDASKTINTKSADAQKPENAALLRKARHGAWGYVEFIWTEFECPDCRKYWTADELHDIEEEALPPATKTLRRVLGRVAFFIIVALWVLLKSIRA